MKKSSSLRDCPKCKSVSRAVSLVPAQFEKNAFSVYGCMACGHSFKEDGTAYVDNISDLRDYFRGATLGHKTLKEGLEGTALSAPAKVLLQAQILEYGTNMWFDGLKQGLLLGAIQAVDGEKHGKVQPD